jgi:steroid delta-isomerase-like uncharacterized protein
MTASSSAAERTRALIQEYYAAFNRGDREAFLALLSDGVRHDINQGGSEVGKAAFRSFMERMDRCYSEQITDLVVMVSENGETAASEFVVRGSYLRSDEGLPPATGQEYTLPGGAFFSIRDGQVTRVVNYYNLSDWLRQVGAG